jgi:tRNA dimethylallyltransferase
MTHDDYFLPHWFLTGPTASGKSAVGLELAQLLDAEIVSLDSMAVFRGMNIGTAKPSAAEQQAVPHHLIDLVDPWQDFSLADYLHHARQACEQILARGKRVLFVGGTPLYLKALLRGVFAGPAADWPLRQRWQQFAETYGNAALHAELAKVDPLSAARLASADVRRIVRALEVFEKTGQSITQLQQQFDRAHPAEACRVFVLDWPRELLAERINQRVDAMLTGGWLDEVRTLISLDHPLSRTARQAVGYCELADHLAGKMPLDSAVESIKGRTRQFAKRQRTWFRSLSECRFVPMHLSTPMDRLAARLAGCCAPD